MFLVVSAAAKFVAPYNRTAIVKRPAQSLEFMIWLLQFQVSITKQKRTLPRMASWRDFCDDYHSMIWKNGL
jgi:hypothetical protein